MVDIILNNRKSIIITAGTLMLFAAIGAALVGVTFDQTEEAIKYNEKQTLLKKLNEIIPSDEYNNDLLLDTTEIGPHNLLGTTESTTVYRARKDNKEVAVIFSSIAPNGYNGSIHILVGVYTDGRIAGVRVVKHRETPGLGDEVDTRQSDWILSFNHKTLHNPDTKHWKVKRDGGYFDQFTGATITPRAVVKAVRDALLYFDANSTKLFGHDTLSSYDAETKTSKTEK